MKLHCILSLAVPMFALAATRADVVFDNFDAGGTFHPDGYFVGAQAWESFGSVEVIRAAAKFTVGAPGFTLDSVRIPISQQSNIPGNFLRIRIAADDNGAPGETLEVLSLNQAQPPFANPFTTATTYTSTAHPMLAAGANYWIVTELTSLPTLGSFQFVQYWWFLNSSAETVPFRQQQVTGALPADPWTGFDGIGQVAFSVHGSPVILAACCNPFTGACAVVLTSACTALGLTPLPAMQTCVPNPCPPGCPANFNGQDGVTVQDIYDFLAAWNAGCP